MPPARHPERAHGRRYRAAALALPPRAVRDRPARPWAGRPCSQAPTTQVGRAALDARRDRDPRALRSVWDVAGTHRGGLAPVHSVRLVRGELLVGLGDYVATLRREDWPDFDDLVDALRGAAGAGRAIAGGARGECVTHRPGSCNTRMPERSSLVARLVPRDARPPARLAALALLTARRARPRSAHQREQHDDDQKDDADHAAQKLVSRVLSGRGCGGRRGVGRGRRTQAGWSLRPPALPPVQVAVAVGASIVTAPEAAFGSAQTTQELRGRGTDERSTAKG